MSEIETTKLTGIWGYVAAGAVGAALAAGITWFIVGNIDAVTIAKGNAEIERQTGLVKDCIATHEKARADLNAQTVTDLNNSIIAARNAADQLARDTAARNARYANFLENLAHVSDSKSCTASPAFRALIDSVRGEPAAAGAATRANH